ncbi:MAG: MATE family efflux transporter [Planctomyces sp.]|nr:MATE family efflux transporter [Planctomyces sp.]
MVPNDPVEQHSAVPIKAEPGGILELIRVAIPLVISSGSLSLMSAADRMILAGYSTDGLAAVTPASMLHWTVVCIPMGTILFANTFISQFDGAGEHRKACASLWQAIWLAVIAGCCLLFMIPFSTSLFSLVKQPPGVIQQEVIYFNTLCSGSICLLVSIAMSCYFSGRQNTSVIMWVNLFGVFVNFGLDYLCVFGVGPLPEMGIRGAALATVLARFGECLIYLTLILRAERGRSLFWSAWRPDMILFRQYMKYGVASGLHYFVDNSGFTTFLLIVGTLGRDALAATNLAFSVNGLIFIPLLGFGTAIQTLVGHHLGSGSIDRASRTARNAMFLGILWTGGAGLLLVLIPELMLKPFTLFAGGRDSAAQSLTDITPTIVLLLRFVAVYSVFDALAVVFSSALRGAGDTVFPMILTMCSSWLIMVVPSILIAQSETATLTKLWMTCSVHISLTGGFMFLRFYSGRWKRIQLVRQ